MTATFIAREVDRANLLARALAKSRLNEQDKDLAVPITVDTMYAYNIYTFF